MRHQRWWLSPIPLLRLERIAAELEIKILTMNVYIIHEIQALKQQGQLGGYISD